MVEERRARNQAGPRGIAVADAHMAAHSPPSYKIDYFEHTMRTLDQVISYAIKEEVDYFLWAGDQFHLKSTQNNPAWFLSAIFERVRRLWDAGIWNGCIGGNHDLRLGSLEGLKGQALELMTSSGMMRLLDTEELRIRFGEKTLRITGASYKHGLAEECRDKKKDGDDFLISVGHFWFGQSSGEFFGEPMFGPDYLGQGEPDLYVIGHHHDDQGIVTMDGKTYCVPGSINRTGAHQGDIDRRPAASLISLTDAGFQVKVLRPKVATVDEYLDLAKRAEIKAEDKEMESLVETLRTTSVVSTDPGQVLDQLDVAVEVRNKAREYLTTAETLLNQEMKRAT
jgi:DNA repair exonuclease SbcCD nuclease subunit